MAEGLSPCRGPLVMRIPTVISALIVAGLAAGIVAWIGFSRVGPVQALPREPTGNVRNQNPVHQGNLESQRHAITPQRPAPDTVKETLTEAEWRELTEPKRKKSVP